MKSAAHYDRIARQWHAVTGAQGGALKKLVLNELVLDRLSDIAGRAILELGAGNGYFMPLVLRRFSGQVPARVVITDQSPVLLGLAQRTFYVADAEYRVLDVRSPFPYAAASFHLILANMVFNEIATAGLRGALAECERVLAADGRLVVTVTHPDFVASLARRGQLKPQRGEVWTMPGAEGLRLPVVRRTAGAYAAYFEQAGFDCRTEDVFASPQVLRAKPGLRQAGDVPLALLLECRKRQPTVGPAGD